MFASATRTVHPSKTENYAKLYDRRHVERTPKFNQKNYNHHRADEDKKIRKMTRIVKMMGLMKMTKVVMPMPRMCMVMAVVDDNGEVFILNLFLVKTFVCAMTAWLF